MKQYSELESDIIGDAFWTLVAVESSALAETSGEAAVVRYLAAIFGYDLDSHPIPTLADNLTQYMTMWEEWYENFKNYLDSTYDSSNLIIKETNNFLETCLGILSQLKNIFSEVEVSGYYVVIKEVHYIFQYNILSESYAVSLYVEFKYIYGEVYEVQKKIGPLAKLKAPQFKSAMVSLFAFVDAINTFFKLRAEYEQYVLFAYWDTESISINLDFTANTLKLALTTAELGLKILSSVKDISTDLFKKVSVAVGFIADVASLMAIVAKYIARAEEATFYEIFEDPEFWVDVVGWIGGFAFTVAQLAALLGAATVAAAATVVGLVCLAIFIAAVLIYTKFFISYDELVQFLEQLSISFTKIMIPVNIIRHSLSPWKQQETYERHREFADAFKILQDNFIRITTNPWLIGGLMSMEIYYTKMAELENQLVSAVNDLNVSVNKLIRAIIDDPHYKGHILGINSTNASLHGYGFNIYLPLKTQNEFQYENISYSDRARFSSGTMDEESLEKILKRRPYANMRKTWQAENVFVSGYFDLETNSVGFFELPDDFPESELYIHRAADDSIITFYAYKVNLTEKSLSRDDFNKWRSNINGNLSLVEEKLERIDDILNQIKNIRPNTVLSAVLKGLHFLETRQNPDGSWQESVGITGLAVLAFLNFGYDESYPVVRKAIDFILSHVHGDGSIYGDSSHITYETSIAIMALVATNNESYRKTIDDAVNWLLAAQWDENSPCSCSIDNWRYGGWGYVTSGDRARPDESNTQFALLALKVAGLSSDHSVWRKAEVWLLRCQNIKMGISITIDGETHYIAPYGDRDDGGFTYQPDYSDSYGSMTAAGVWSLALVGVSLDDIRMTRAINWLAEHYDFTQNPGKGSTYLYYYYFTIAKALELAGLETLGGRDWYYDLATNLTFKQRADGSWVGSSAGWENIPELSTAYALLAYMVKLPPFEYRAPFLLRVSLESDAELRCYVGQKYLGYEHKNKTFYSVGLFGVARVEKNNTYDLLIMPIYGLEFRLDVIGLRIGTATLGFWRVGRENKTCVSTWKISTRPARPASVGVKFFSVYGVFSLFVYNATAKMEPISASLSVSPEYNVVSVKDLVVLDIKINPQLDSEVCHIYYSFDNNTWLYLTEATFVDGSVRTTIPAHELVAPGYSMEVFLKVVYQGSQCVQPSEAYTKIFVDGVSPEVEVLSYDLSGNNIILYFVARDDIALAQVNLSYYDNATMSWTNVPVENIGEDIYCALIPVGSQNRIVYKIYAIDKAGNDKTVYGVVIYQEKEEITKPFLYELFGIMVGVIALIAMAIVLLILMRRKFKNTRIRGDIG